MDFTVGQTGRYPGGRARRCVMTSDTSRRPANHGAMVLRRMTCCRTVVGGSQCRVVMNTTSRVGSHRMTGQTGGATTQA